MTSGSFALERHFRPEPGGDLPFQLERVRGHLYYGFPPGSSILSAPLVALARPFGYTAVGRDGTYDPEGERRLEKRISVVLGAGFVLVVFFTARLLLPLGWSALIALVSGLGTQVWSTVSRAHWSHGWLVILLGLAAYELLAAEARGRPLRALWLGTLLPWAYFTRPTAAIALAAVTLWLGLRHRPRLPGFLLLGGGWGLAFALWSWRLYGALVPSYFRAQRLGSSSFFEALLGNLVSPARGVLVFVPQLLFVFYLLGRYRRHLPFRPLAGLALAVCVGHWVAISTFPHWWGGHSYGPRLMTDALPWLALLAVLAVYAWHRSGEAGSAVTTARRRRSAEVLVGVSLVVLSALIHATGAWSWSANLWNRDPADVDLHPERLWEWRNPPFLPH